MKNDFKYVIDYDYGGYNDCESYGCDEEGICRCYTIDYAEVESNIDINSIVDKTMRDLSPTGISKKRNDKLNQLFPDDTKLDRYGIYRLSVIHKLWDPKLYEVEVEGGYYGQEIGDIILDEDVFKKWSKDCIDFFSLDTTQDKILFLLEREYGKVLPNLIEKTPKLITISFDDIDWSGVNPNHIKNVKNENCPYYESGYDLPLGIVRKTGNKYQLVDGYHRILKTKEPKFEVYSF
jgi:hypothetical protein